MDDKLVTIHPDGSNVNMAKSMADDVVTAIIDHLSHLNRRRVLIPSDHPPEVSSPLSWEETLSYIQDVIAHSMQVSHPRFFAHMDSGPVFISLLADWVTSALNQNMLSHELSPLATQIEEVVLRWMCERCGYEGGEGTFVSGGTMANFTGLLLALHQVTEGQFRQEGIWALSKKPIIFTSDQSHYSITKAAAGTGLGEQSVVKVQTDERFRMNVHELSRAIQQAKDDGKLPLMVIATAGTTSTGSVDPIDDIVTVCNEHKIWLHVDAAHGGGALFSDRARSKLVGIDRADSITIDPHKWLMQPKGMGACITRHEGLLNSLFQADAPYLRREAIRTPTSRGGMTFQGSRRFDALRLWVTRLYLGDDGIGELVDQGLRQVKMWQALLKERNCFELAHEPDLNLVCFRYRRGGLSDDELNRLNEQIQRELMLCGEGFVSITTLRGKRWLRSVFLNPSTAEKDMRVVMGVIERLGHQLQKAIQPSLPGESEIREAKFNKGSFLS